MSRNSQHSASPSAPVQFVPQQPLHPQPSQPNTSHTTHRISNAIGHGADQLLALIEEERVKAEAHNRRHLDELNVRFEQYRVAAENREQQLSQRLWELEMKLKDQENSSSMAVNEGVSQISGGIPQSTSDCSHITPSVATDPQNLDTRLSEDRTGLFSHAVQAELDSETVHLLSQLGIRTIRAASQDQGPNSTTTIQNAIQMDLTAVDFAPRILQFLSYHTKALKDWEGKYNTVKREHEELQQRLQQYNVPSGQPGQPAFVSKPIQFQQVNQDLERSFGRNHTMGIQPKIESNSTSALASSMPQVLNGPKFQNIDHAVGGLELIWKNVDFPQSVNSN